MKRIILAAAALILAISLCACSGVRSTPEAAQSPEQTASGVSEPGEERGELIYDEDTPGYSLRLDAGFDGLELDGGSEYTLDGEVEVYVGTLGGGNDMRARIEDYLKLNGLEVSEWLSLDTDDALSEEVGYPVWIAEYYVGHEEDTNLCVDAVVIAGEPREDTLILHTVRDADLDMNTDIDYGARIRELFAAIEIA